MKIVVLLLFAIGFFGVLPLAPVLASHTTTNTGASDTASECIVNISWENYTGQRRITYGKWDGTYTVFLYRSGENRDHYVLRKTVPSNQFHVTNLRAGNYVAEVFLTGAFLHPDVPYWKKLSAFPCEQNVETSAPKTKIISSKGGSTNIMNRYDVQTDSNVDIMSKYRSTGPTVDIMNKYDVEAPDRDSSMEEIADETPKVLPETGWTTWILGFFATTVVLSGLWLFSLGKFSIKSKLT